jgi:hypothetical protein
MTVITWSEFPQIKENRSEQSMALIVSEMFLPPTMIDKEKFRQITRKLANLGVLN